MGGTKYRKKIVSKSLPGRTAAEHSGSEAMKPMTMARMLSGHCQELVCMRCTAFARSVLISTMLTTIAVRLLASASITSSAVAFRRRPAAECAATPTSSAIASDQIASIKRRDQKAATLRTGFR